MHRLGLAALALALALPAAARAEEPPHYSFDPRPPGKVFTSRLVYLGGEAMHSEWRAVVSKAMVSPVATQGYLSIYALNGTVYHLKYRSPKSAIPFGSGATFDWASLTSGNLMGTAAAQQLVVITHVPATTDTECGRARLDILFFDAAMQSVMPTLSLRNKVALTARVIHDAAGTALSVRGPYYKPGNHRCRADMLNATAILRFNNGTWSESPDYFPIVKGD